jgi:hypothetical protein
MTETDLQLGGGYTYQWECAILLALNYFFESVRYNPILYLKERGLGFNQLSLFAISHQLHRIPKGQGKRPRPCFSPL